MHQNNINILSTRPVSDAAMAKAKAEGIELDVISFIETKNVVDSALEKQITTYAQQEVTVVFTSMNAVEAIVDLLRKNNMQPTWQIFTLAASTGSLVKEYFQKSSITSSARNASELAEQVIEGNPPEIVFFCGNIRRDELPGKVKANGISLAELVVYETIETSHTISKEYHAILFYSPSAVTSFFAVNRISTHTILFAIGKTTAEEIKGFSNNTVIESVHPSKDMMVEQAIAFFQTVNHNK